MPLHRFGERRAAHGLLALAGVRGAAIGHCDEALLRVLPRRVLRPVGEFADPHADRATAHGLLGDERATGRACDDAEPAQLRVPVEDLGDGAA